MAKNSVRVKRSAEPIVFNFELEPGDDELEDQDQSDDNESDEDNDDPDVHTPTIVAPTSFVVGGRTYQMVERLTIDGIEIERHWFRAKRKVRGVMLLNVLGAGTDNAAGAAAIAGFLDRAVDKRDRQRFADLIDHSNPPIGLDELNGIIEFLIEQYAGRPTGQSAP